MRRRLRCSEIALSFILFTSPFSTRSALLLSTEILLEGEMWVYHGFSEHEEQCLKNKGILKYWGKEE